MSSGANCAPRDRGAQPPTLVRAIGVRTLAASIVNTTVGAGIFVLPAAGIIPPLACAAIAWILARATALEFALLGAVLGVGVVVYLLPRARQTQAAR